MPWYKSGTVSVVLNSNAVIGAGTAFIANSRVGDAFRGPDGAWYEVINIASDTAMSISPNYQGATNATGTYALAPMQGYVKDSADQLRAFVNTYGSKLAALGTTGNYDILPVNKGGTGGNDQATARTGLGLGTVSVENIVPLNKGGTARTDGRALFSEVGVGLAAALYGTQGLYMGWNSASQGEGHFIVNKGGGNGGFTWRSVNADNTATGPAMSYSYAGLLTVPSLAVTNPIPVTSGGTGGNSQATARTALGLGATDGPTVAALEISAANPFIDFHYGSSAVDYTTRIIANSANFLSITTPTSSGMSIGSVLYPNTDGGVNCGSSTNRFATLFAISGTINTSDAREKTEVTPMSQNQIAAAMLLGREIGTYKWLSAVADKGDEARNHVGMTVQRAIEIMESQGLSPLEYAFICHDEWEAIEEQRQEIVRGNIYSVGDLLYENAAYSVFEQYKEFPAFTWEETSREIIITQQGREAGDRYGFRYEQLALFIARGQEERLARLEARFDAPNS